MGFSPSIGVQGAYTSYTPTLSGTSTDPTLGSGSSATGYYQQVGKRVYGYVNITFGSSGVNAGSGYYGILLPVAPVNRDQPIGTGYLIDSSDSNRAVLCAFGVATTFYAAATSKGVLVLNNVATDGFGDGNNPATASVPWTWAAGDTIAVQFDYEAA